MKNTMNTQAARSTPRRSAQVLLCAAMVAVLPSLTSATPGGIGQKAKATASEAASTGKKAAGKAKKAGGVAKQDPLGAILATVEEAREVANATRDQVQSLVQRVDLGASFLDGATLDQVADQARSAVELIKSQFEGKDEFVSKHAKQFKADLIGLLTDLRTLRHEIRGLTTSNCWPRVETAERTPLIDMIEQMPDAFLYPAWKGLPDNLDCLIQDVRDGVESVRTIRAIVGDPFSTVQVGNLFTEVDALSADAALFAARLDAAQPYLENLDTLSDGVARLQRTAKAVDLFAAVLDALGEADTTATLGVHGYAQVEIDADTMKIMAKFLLAGGKVTSEVASLVNGKLTEAKSVSTVNLILKNQEEILRNQEALLSR